MRVVGAGLPRTATTTQMVALEQLGLGPCYHMRNMIADLPAGVGLWRRAYDGEAPWEEAFDGFQSTCDWPSAFHWRELMDAYPDAKVLLSVREGEGWARSMNDTICQIYFGDSLMRHLSRAREQIDPDWHAWVELMTDMCWRGRGPFAGTEGERDALIAGMERWNDEVKATVPAERLLHPRRGGRCARRVVGARGAAVGDLRRRTGGRALSKLGRPVRPTRKGAPHADHRRRLRDDPDT